MNLAEYPLHLHLHLWSALTALMLGPFVLYRRRRDTWHRVAGRIWVAVMALAAGSALWLEAQIAPLFMGFGAIHLLCAVVFFGLWRAVTAARSGDVVTHSAWMRGLYWQALVLPGLLTLLPGRTLNHALLGGDGWSGLVVILSAGLLVGLGLVLRRSSVWGERPQE